MKPGEWGPTVPMLDVNGLGHIDALGRVGFARELLEVIRVLPAEGGSVVLGLEGEWGSGKTWVLDRLGDLNEELPAAQQVLLVRFNPWMVSGSAEIVETECVREGQDQAGCRLFTPTRRPLRLRVSPFAYRPNHRPDPKHHWHR